MKDRDISVTRGYNQSFGAFSKKLLSCFCPDLISVICKNCVPKKTPEDDAETRKVAVRSLIKVVTTIGIENIETKQRSEILETFYQGFDDYAVDRRGDVGSWVRSEAMISLSKYVQLLVTCEDKQALNELGGNTAAFYERFINLHLQQLNEKIDRVRENAGRSLQDFFRHTVAHTDVDFSMRTELMQLFMTEL